MIAGILLASAHAAGSSSALDSQELTWLLRAQLSCANASARGRWVAHPSTPSSPSLVHSISISRSKSGPENPLSESASAPGLVEDREARADENTAYSRPKSPGLHKERRTTKRDLPIPAAEES